MMIHGVKLEECSELGVKMTFPDGSTCDGALLPRFWKKPRWASLDGEEEYAPTDADKYTGRFSRDKTPEDKEIDEAALKLLYSRLARAYLNGELDVKPSTEENVL